ncbi:hypothetical protein LSUB1_G008327, partial [Lachnellula subtilissima]
MSRYTASLAHKRSQGPRSDVHHRSNRLHRPVSTLRRSCQQAPIRNQHIRTYAVTNVPSLTLVHRSIPTAQRRQHASQTRHFHDYFVTNLPSSSLHPDSRSSGPHHKLPRSASTPHTTRSGASPAAAPLMIGASRELTVVRIPLRSAKHHFGVSFSRGTRPYNEDTYQAGTLEVPAFAKRAPISLSRKGGPAQATSAESASGDPQVFYFGVFDGHGGNECSDFLREELHGYVERTAALFELKSSLKKGGSQREVSPPAEENLKKVEMKSKEDVEGEMNMPKTGEDGGIIEATESLTLEGDNQEPVESNISKTIELEKSLVSRWKETVGGYFRRFKPDYFAMSSSTDGSPPKSHPISIETVLMYAFLKADLDFVTAQAQKPDPDNHNDTPLNANDILGEPAHLSSKYHIGGPNRF